MHSPILYARQNSIGMQKVGGELDVAATEAPKNLSQGLMLSQEFIYRKRIWM